MNQIELDLEKERLARTLNLIDAEMVDLDRRLSAGIEAADAQTAEALTRQFIGRLKVLLLIKDKPYFARVDFTPKGAGTDRMYIGKSTVLNGSGDVEVVDWRAPASTLYYEGRVGDASYTCPDGLIEGEIALKRQFEIEDRELLDYRDIDITFDEELLKPYLAVESNMRLKNIIATIQSEQNRIIRAGMLKPLIVQGVAGSGKTTVALHRIAYLIYTYAASLKTEQFLIIAPNALFLDYISNVLPDLGVEDVRQSTYETLVQELIGKKLKVEDPGEKLGRILSGENPDGESAASHYKSSLRFKEAIDGFLQDLQGEILPKEDFRAGGYVLCPYKILKALFEKELSSNSLAKRVDFIRERLLKTIPDQANRIIAEIDRNRRKAVAGLPENLTPEERKAMKAKIYEQDEEIVRDLLGGGKGSVKAYLKKIRLPSALECYQRLLSNSESLRHYTGELGPEITPLLLSGVKLLPKGRVEVEDLAPLLYIHVFLQGVNSRFAVRHVVIDEAQDFSSFQFLALRQALGCSSFTIFGDIAQGIYQYRGTNDWNAVSEDVFDGTCDLVTLEKSYRSTVEIMEQANLVLSKLPEPERLSQAVPVIRNGEPVRYVPLHSDIEISGYIAKRVKEMQAAGHRNIAVICKLQEDCERFASLLKKYGLGFTIIGGKEYGGGLSIVPSYLVKGLEFDAVLIADAHRYEQRDIKLLYVAMTRAMHEMDVLYIGEKPELLK